MSYYSTQILNNPLHAKITVTVFYQGLGSSYNKYPGTSQASRHHSRLLQNQFQGISHTYCTS